MEQTRLNSPAQQDAHVGQPESIDSSRRQQEQEQEQEQQQQQQAEFSPPPTQAPQESQRSQALQVDQPAADQSECSRPSVEVECDGRTVATGERPQQVGASDQPKRTKISARSQSSPSSLTTHKFGLRPTPSPPRLIIDHQTGDIIESYPEQPVYLRTYQPLDDYDTSVGNTNDDDLSECNTLGGACELNLEGSSSAADQPTSGRPTMSGRPAPNNAYRPAIPPPHSAGAGKVYFAPPEPSASHLFGQPSAPEQRSQFMDPEQLALLQQQQQQQQQLDAEVDARADSSLRRVLSKLNDASKTDIAIVTADDEAGASSRWRQVGANMRVTATSPARASALMSQQGQQVKFASGSNPSKHHQPQQQHQLQQQRLQHHRQQQQILLQQPPAPHKQPIQTGKANRLSGLSKQRPPSIDDFSLYTLSFSFTLLLAALTSALIIYLLVGPLGADCGRYRPTFTHVSMIVSGVNVVCLAVFSLFWFCNGVTRTLYANLSSSAFIASMYTILVAINLALAIMLFFANTCNFQRLISTARPAPLALHSPYYLSSRLAELALQAQSGAREDLVAPVSAGEFGSHSSGGSRARRHRNSNHDDGDEDANSGGADSQDSPDDFATDQQLARPPSQPRPPSAQPAPASEPELAHEFHAFQVSPIEAAWEYTRDGLRAFGRAFARFLRHYDLKFVGALHAICAICLQLAAIKVAVVRSHFCSPDTESLAV